MCSECVGNALFTIHEIEHEEIVGRKRCQPFAADLFEEPEKLRIVNLASQSYEDLISVGASKIRGRFPFSDALFKHQIHSLAGAFDQPTFGKSFGNTAIARGLAPQDVVLRHAGREAAWTDQLQAARVLTDEHRASKTVVPVAHGIENRFTDRSFIERRDIQNKEPRLQMLPIIPQVDGGP